MELVANRLPGAAELRNGGVLLVGANDAVGWTLADDVLVG